jgi:hypothetical protein
VGWLGWALLTASTGPFIIRHIEWISPIPSPAQRKACVAPPCRSPGLKTSPPHTPPGESYAGIYVPNAVRAVVEGNHKGHKPYINIKVEGGRSLMTRGTPGWRAGPVHRD